MFVLLFIGCGDNEKVILDKSEYEKLIKLPQSEYPKLLPKPIVKTEFFELDELQVIEIDGCEYIFGSTKGYHGGIVLTHKGNCKNKTHYEHR